MGSPTRACGNLAGTRTSSSSPFANASWLVSEVALSTTLSSSKSTCSREIRPASTFEKSRISLINPEEKCPRCGSCARNLPGEGESRLESQARQPNHCVHWCSDFMAHICKEAALGEIRRLCGLLRCLQLFYESVILRCSLLHPLLQTFIQVTDLLFRSQSISYVVGQHEPRLVARKLRFVGGDFHGK